MALHVWANDSNPTNVPCNVCDGTARRFRAAFLRVNAARVICAQVCLTDQHLAVVMDVALGGNLTSYVSDQYKHAERHGLFLAEKDARYFFRQFITTVAFCHRHHIAHRCVRLASADFPTRSSCDLPARLMSAFKWLLQHHYSTYRHG